MRLNVYDRPGSGNFMSGSTVCAGGAAREDRRMVRVRRRWPWLLAALLHAGLLGLLARCERPRDLGEPSIEMEVVEMAEAAEPAATEVVEDEAPAAEAPVPDRAAARRDVRRIEEPALEPEAKAEPGSAGGGATGESGETGLDLGWVLGSIGEGKGGGGSGGGAGGAGGVGRGGGRGGTRAARTAAPARSPRRISRARPPQLVYPKRFRDERGGEVFVALLTVDEDGWVVGVRLVQGVNPHADQKALDAVWRFHYDPALDQAGRPIRARVTQRFMVE
jgi:TonB family protein